MKVLMITPRVDMEHDIFGFIHGWVDELSKRVDNLEVVTFGVGKTKLGDNVNLYSAYSKYQPVKFLKLNKFLLSLTPRVDVVFTHMYPWLPIAAAPYAKVFGKPLVMFNAHGHVDFKKKLAAALVDRVVTSSDRGFNIDTPKKVVIGQGIDTERFKPSNNEKKDVFRILAAGRIDKIKGYDIVIDALNVIINIKRRYNVRLKIVGPIYDNNYFIFLKDKISKYSLKDYITFEGHVPYKRLHIYYQQCDLFANPSYASSLEKTVLEAMACGKPVITSNIAYYRDVFDAELREKCFFEPGNYKELASKIEYFIENDNIKLKKKLRKIVVKDHSIKNFTKNLVKVFESVR